jgi:hypothetical protein
MIATNAAGASPNESGLCWRALYDAMRAPRVGSFGTRGSIR